ncbi:MAG: hypothetical protein LH491_00940 [Pseudoxanthomonas sp.]|nr:hypothetical protein [Pseudoxanthomonas sp.]
MMAISKRKLVGIVLAALVVLAVAACALLGWRANQSQRVEVLDTLKGQVIELEAVQQQLQQRRVPDDWKVGAFLSTAALNQALDTLEGAQVQLAELPGNTFEVISLEASPRSGSTRVLISLRVSSDSRPQLAVKISGSALLLLRGVEHDPAQGTDRAMFSLSMLEIAPALSWRALTFSGSRFANQIVSSQATELVAEGLKFSLPLRVPAIIPLKLDNVATISAGQSSYGLRLGLPPSSIDASFDLAAPIATRQGVWMMGGDRPALDLPSAASLPDDPAELRKRVEQLEQSIESRLSQVSDPAADTALWISRAYGASVFEGFNQLSEDQRRISVSLENPNGSLAERNFSFLGQQGGFSSTLKSGAGSLQVGQIQTQWVPGEGVRAAVPLRATATAQVDSRVFPPRIFGGSRQIDATLSGTATETINLTLSARRVSSQGHDALVMGPVVGCEVINLTLETQSEPRLGLRQALPLTDIPVDGIILLDTVPREFARTLPADGRVRFVGKPAWIIAAWKNPRVEIAEAGYLVRADFSASQHSKPQAVQSNAAALRAGFQQAWARQTRPACPPRKGPVVLLNGNDVVETEDIANVARLIMGSGRPSGRQPPRAPPPR